MKIETPLGCLKIGRRVRKIRGSSWNGRIVGYYSTSLTNVGYAVESEREPGSVQIYPASALELVGTSCEHQETAGPCSICGYRG